MAAKPSSPPRRGRRPPYGGSLYVTDLDPRVTEEELRREFAVMGPICSLRLLRKRKWVPDRLVRGKALRSRFVGAVYTPRAITEKTAVVHFYNRQDAAKALNFAEIMGKQMSVMWYERDAATRKIGFSRIILVNLEASISCDELACLCSSYGTVLHTKIGEKVVKQTYFRFGIVLFDEEESALKAIHDLHGMEFNGKELFVSKYVNEAQKKRNSKRKFVDEHDELSYLYVKNLNESVDDLKLFQLFSDCEGILCAKVIYSTRGKSRGCGFVGFCSHEAAKEACYGGEIVRMGRESLKIVQTFQFGPLNLGINDEGDDEEDPPDDLLNAGMIGREGQNDIQEGLSVYVQDGDEPVLVDTLEMLGCDSYDEFARRLHESWAKVLNEEPLQIIPPLPLTWPGHNLIFDYFDLELPGRIDLDPYADVWIEFESMVDRVLATPSN